MSYGQPQLHSHSALERELHLPKHIVLVDEKYENLFSGEKTKEFKYGHITYLMVNTYSFFKKGGVFRNLME